MKTLSKKLMMAAAMFLSTSSFAAAGEGVVMEVTGTNTFKLILNDLQQGLTVQLKDQFGYTLHEEVVQGTAYGKEFNLSALPNGQYFLELDYSAKVDIYPLFIENGRVTKAKLREVFKPVVNLKGENLSITHLAPRKSALRVMIYNENQEVILNDTMSGDISLGRIYDLSELKEGEYQVYLASEGHNYQHNLRLQ